MSYPRDLDEYTADELRAELERREQARRDGVCDYCGRDPRNTTCRMKSRHIAALPASSGASTSGDDPNV